MPDKKKCPICGKLELVGTGQVTYFNSPDGDTISSAYIHYSVCLNCGEELVSKAQEAANEASLDRVNDDIQEHSNIVTSADQSKLDS